MCSYVFCNDQAEPYSIFVDVLVIILQEAKQFFFIFFLNSDTGILDADNDKLWFIFHWMMNFDVYVNTTFLSEFDSVWL